MTKTSSQSFLPLGKRETNKFPGPISVQNLSQIGTVLVEEQAEARLRGCALAFDRLAKSLAFNLNAQSSNCISEVSCSLSSYSLSIKSVTNLFNP